MSTINIGGQEIPTIGIALALPLISAMYVAYDGYFAEESLYTRYEAINAQMSAVAEKKGQAEELKQRTKEIDRVKAEIAEFEKSITLLRSKIPGDAQVPVLLFDIERMARDSHGDLAAFQPGELRQFSGEGAGGDIQELPVTIQASATFPQVIQFMERLSSYERKLSVSNLSLTPAAAKVDAKGGGMYQNTLQLQFTLNAYVLKGKGD